MLENILPMSLICPKVICCFEARSHSNVDKAISENHSVTSFKIKVAHALKPSRSTKYMKYKEKIRHEILRLIKAQVMLLH